MLQRHLNKKLVSKNREDSFSDEEMKVKKVLGEKCF